MTLVAALTALSTTACVERTDVQCETDDHCNLGLNGLCTMNTTGNWWCTHADSMCASGRRWSDLDVGDGVSGKCVSDDSIADAGANGIDAPDTADARTADARGLDAMPPTGPNCEGLPATCGPLGTDDCCASEEVPGGTYYRNYDTAGDNYNDMGYPATVSTFRLDTYEVTVGRFRAFVEAGMGTQLGPPPGSAGARMLNGATDQGGWETGWNTNLRSTTPGLIGEVKCDSTYETWTDTVGANETKAMSCLTWYEAFAFCVWDGGFLPTEAEWNYAATGGSEQRAYPWSSPSSSTAIDCSYANYWINVPAGMYCENGTTGGAGLVGSRAPAGNGRWGHSDMAGSTWEWVLDWYGLAPPTPCVDCANLTMAGIGRGVRGGDFRDTAAIVRSAVRTGLNPSNNLAGQGVRCARAP